MDGPCGRRACNELDMPWRVESVPAVTAGGLVTPTGTSTKINVKHLTFVVRKKNTNKTVFYFELIKKLGSKFLLKN